MTPSRIAAAFRRRPRFHIIAFTLTVLIAVAALAVVRLWWRAPTTWRWCYGGLGLGLAIVRHLVELHGGTVTAEGPGSDRGAAFRVGCRSALSRNRSSPLMMMRRRRPTPHPHFQEVGAACVSVAADS